MEDKKIKRVSIKNKKDIKNTLAKASIKGKTSLKKQPVKNSSIKKKNIRPAAKKIQEDANQEKKHLIKEPNNIKRKIEKNKKIEEKSFTSRIEFPKEWKTINSKNNKVKVKEQEKQKTIKGRIRSSIFESVDEKTLEERKKKEKEGLKKLLIVFLIVFAAFGLLILALIKYNDFVKKQFAVYKAYRIGDIVYLNDDSQWYVIQDTSSKEEYVKLLSNRMLDINDDGIVDTNDMVVYNSTNSAEYDSSNENSAAYFLNGSAKQKIEDAVGHVKDISLLTRDEYVKVRDRMNYGDEWNEGNWLASDNFQKWWVLSDKNDKVYVVSSKGTFYLSDAKNLYFIRPTITIKKELVSKQEEKKDITLDLINGLK